ncbi:MAG: hypothetical protein NVSMB6_24750 [Burkholderiaceae bacterium]
MELYAEADEVLPIPGVEPQRIRREMGFGSTGSGGARARASASGGVAAWRVGGGGRTAPLGVVHDPAKGLRVGAGS